jgi:hypothetical protein
MADVAVGSIGHQIPISVVGRKMANEVTIDPKKPDHRAGEQKQACGLQRGLNQPRQKTPMRVFEEYGEFGDAENRD